MRLGFFDMQIESLLYFREMVAAYPHNDFYFYAETAPEFMGSESPKEEAYAKAALYLIERGVGCICVAPSIDSEVFENVLRKYTHAIDVIQFGGFESYAIENDLSQPSDAQGIRSIHLTEHSPTTNERIAVLLGGHFIEE